MGQGKGKEGKKRKNKAGYHLVSSQVIGMGKWGGVAAAVGGDVAAAVAAISLQLLSPSKADSFPSRLAP